MRRGWPGCAGLARFLCGHHEIVVQYARFDAFPSGGGRFPEQVLRGNVGLGKGTPPLSIPPKASECGEAAPQPVPFNVLGERMRRMYDLSFGIS